MQSVLARLDAKDPAASNLARLWAGLQEDLADPKAVRCGKLEAEPGFDPEECSEDALNAALPWEKKMGDGDLSSCAIDEAADRLEDCAPLVTMLLLNNGYIHHLWSRKLPYRVAARAGRAGST